MSGMGNSGREKYDLMEYVIGVNLIRSQRVERAFRVLDPADYLFYMMPEDSDQAFKVSAICIYSQVMDRLELHPGLSFLNVGSSTGYLSTLVGLIIGSSGISHGIEVLPAVVDNANKILNKFLKNSPALDEFDFCEPKYYRGNGLCIAPLKVPYDRVYCEAGCPEGYQNYFKQLIKVGGILVMTLNNHLVQIRRLSETEWVSRRVLDLSLARFATLSVPTKAEAAELIRLDEQCPPNLQLLARSVIRSAMRAGILRRHPNLRGPPLYNVLEEVRNLIHDSEDGVYWKTSMFNLVLSMEQERVGSAREVNAVFSLLARLWKNSEADDHEVNAVLSRLLSMDLNRVGNASNMQAFVSLLLSMKQNRKAEGEGDEPGDDDDGGSGSSAGGGTPRNAGSPPLKDDEDEDSSDEETQEETNTRKDNKRLKLDSDKGEETTPTSDSSPLKSESEIDDSHGDGSRRSESLTDDMDDSQKTSRRPKRRRLQSPRAGASSSRPSGSGAPRPRHIPAPQSDPRRERLYLGSYVMQQGIKELPIPHDFKMFLNLGRRFMCYKCYNTQ